jgi:hypothetical protein
LKKSGNRKFEAKTLFTMVLSGLLLLAFMVSFPVFARAASDSDGDAKVQAMRSDLMACMQPGAAGQKAREAFAKKYTVPVSKLNQNVPDRPPASNGGWDRTTSNWVCGAEYLTGVGAAIWQSRKCTDKYNGGADPYCIDYSMACDHYKWRGGCLQEKQPGCCSTSCK